jgi:endonuclease/exonuclease/phosphatase family metal-dependent hydrolase
LKKILHKVFLVVNILFASALLISYLAVHINPKDFALPAFFGLAYPYLLLVNVIIAIIWAVNLKIEALISVIVIAIGYTHLSNYIKFLKSDGDRNGTFKVMSYNLKMFNYFENKNNTEDRVVAFMKNQHADILCLQEVFFNGNPALKDQEMKITFGDNYNSHSKLIGRGKNKYYGIATYTRFPIVGKGEILHSGSSSLSIYTDILVGKDTFRIFNNHLQSFRLKSMERSFFEELVDSENKQAMHDIKSLFARLKNGFVLRALQSQVVKGYINKSPYPVIVTGDFNDTPVSYSYRRIRKGLNDAFVKSGYGAGFTYRGNYPPNRIDYILYNGNLVSTNFEIMKVKYSDHYPIVAYLKKSY